MDVSIDSNTNTNSNAIINVGEIAERIINASPILEAFGNAKTIRNANSSRFGKWMVLNFDSQNVIHSSNIVSYLLEKSRVTQRDSFYERNFHIFYQLIRGLPAEQLKHWHISSDTRSYRYLDTGTEREAIDLSDAKTFKNTLNSFVRMGFSDEETTHLFKLVLAILQIGNIEFTPTRDEEASEVKNIELVNDIAYKFSVSPAILAYSLCNRSIDSGKTKKNLINIQLNVQKATETRDSLARAIYEKLFMDIIATINSKSRDSNFREGLSDRCIGLLDIFGFEIFVENSFEQLCINYCNEMLQNHFNFVIFTAEKNLYREECIVCDTIEFKDNIDVIKDIEGLFKALDEESRIPKGTSKTWFDKLKRGTKSPHLAFPTRKKGDIFTVKHYAGDVDYNSFHFLDKNIETLNNDLVGTMSASADPTILKLFSKATFDEVPQTPVVGMSRTFSFRDSEPSSPSPDGRLSIPRKGAGASLLSNKSISWRFIHQLTSLMGMLKKTHSHFIRCIKSNDECSAQRFNPILVYKQLVYSGVFEVVKIQQSGLPCRMPHSEFLRRYRCLAPSESRYKIHTPTELLRVLSTLGYDLRMAKVGLKLTFFKSFEQRQLEARREKIRNAASTKITCFLQKTFQRSAYLKLIEQYRKFQKSNEALDQVGAVPAYKKFVDACDRLHRLVQRECLEHVVRDVGRELSFLEQRVELITSAKNKLAQRTKENVRSLQEVLNRAEELEISSHPVVKDCKDIYERFKKAVDFLHIVHRSNQSGSGYTVQYQPGSVFLRDLSAAQISEGVDLLTEFRDILDDGALALSDVLAFQAAVNAEMLKILAPLEANMRRGAAKYDSEGGNIILVDQERGMQAFQKLKVLVQNLDHYEFVSVDVQKFYQDCKAYVTIMDEFIAKGDAAGTVEAVERVKVKRVVSPALHNMFEDFKKWADIQLSAEKLDSFLREGFIPGSDNGSESTVICEPIESLLSCLEDLKMPSVVVVSVLRTGKLILQVSSAHFSCGGPVGRSTH